MITELLLIVAIAGTLAIAYSQKLIYDEIKGLYSKIGINTEKTEKNRSSKIKNHIKRRMIELEQGGE